MNKEEEIDPKNIDFSQYIPNWKNEQDDDSNKGKNDQGRNDSDWYFEKGFENALNPEDFIDPANEVKWRHVIKAAELLKERHNDYVGPYSHEQVSEIVFEVVLKEALNDLIQKKMLKQNDDGTYQLTQDGIKEAKRLKKTIEQQDNESDKKD